MKKVTVVALVLVVMLATNICNSQIFIGLGCAASSHTLRQEGLLDLQCKPATTVSVYLEASVPNSFKGRVEIAYTRQIYAKGKPWKAGNENYNNFLSAKVPNVLGVTMLYGWNFLEAGIRMNASTSMSTFRVRYPNEPERVSWVRRGGLGSVDWVVGFSPRISNNVRLVARYYQKLDGHSYSLINQPLEMSSVVLGLSVNLVKLWD